MTIKPKGSRKSRTSSAKKSPYEPFLTLGVPSFAEFCAIEDYLETGKTTGIEEILTDDNGMSKPFLAFVAEIVGRRVKPKKKPIPRYMKEIVVFLEVESHLKQGLPLTSTRGNSALTLVADNRCMSESKASEYYYKGKDVYERVCEWEGEPL